MYVNRASFSKLVLIVALFRELLKEVCQICLVISYF